MKNEKINRDVLNSFLVENADYEGCFELSKLKTSTLFPEKVITFSKAMGRNFKDFDCFVIFYEDDKKFERLWNNPKQYLSKLKKFKGVISPDFSLYRNIADLLAIPVDLARGDFTSAGLDALGVLPFIG